MKDGCAQSSIGPAVRQNSHKVFGLSGAAGGDDRHSCCRGHSTRQVAIEAGLDAVRVHRRQEDLAGPKMLTPLRPFDRIDAFIEAASFGEYIPLASRVPACIDSEDNGLRTKLFA